MGQLEIALEALAREPEATRGERERSRDVFEAASRLAFEEPHRSRHARAVLHREGAFSALRALTGSPSSSSPSEVVSAALMKPGLLSEAEAAALRNAAADSEDALRELHRKLLEEAETLPRQVASIQIRRVRLVGGALILGATLLVAGSWGIAALASPRDLARGKAWRTSSVGLVCKPREHMCGKTRTDILFHTNNEQDPWFEVDLESPTTFSSLTIRNRMDMGVARASPLVVEVTDDHLSWREVARRAEPFSTWAPIFPPTTARYVRLRVLKKTWFHLEAVEVHP